MTNPVDPHAWLMGVGVPSAKFDSLGRTVAGPIFEEPVVRQQTDFDTGQPKHWETGEPMMQLLITLVTDERDPNIQEDKGHRRLYVKGNLQAAIADAVRKIGAKLAPGGVLSVTYIGDDEPKRKGMKPAKRYTASYTPPAQNFLEQQGAGGPGVPGQQPGFQQPAPPQIPTTPQYPAASQQPAPWQQPAAQIPTTPQYPAASQQPAAPPGPWQQPAAPQPGPPAPMVDAAALAAALAQLSPDQRAAMGLPPG